IQSSLPTWLQRAEDKESLPTDVGDLFQLVPQTPVKKGQQWDSDPLSEAGPVGVVQRHNHYVYEGAEGDLHHIKNEPTFTYLLTKKQPTSQLGFEVKDCRLATNEAVGMIEFDNREGFMRSYDMKITLLVRMTVDQKGQQKNVEWLDKRHITIMSERVQK